MEWKSKIESWLLDQQDEWVNWLSRYVQADSVQGNEKKAQEWVASKLRSMGLEVDMWEPDGQAMKSHPYFYSPRDSFSGSPNVIGVWRGTGGGRSVILNGHTDVVPAGDPLQWNESPFSGTVKEGKLYGRGSTDMKGGNAASLLAVQCLKELGVKLKGDVILQSVVEEESGGSGTLAALLRGYQADAAIIPEPTHMKIFPKQQGSMWFRMTIQGRSAHGGTRYEGVSAIDKSLAVIEAIRRLETRRNDRIKDPLYENTPIPIPINVGVIHGGEWPSSVPDLVKIEGRMGVAPEETMESAKRDMAEALELLKNMDPWFAAHPVQLDWFGARWVPGSIDVEHELMNRLTVSYRQVMGSDPVIEGSPWGTDGGLLTQLGKIPTIVFGPGVTGMAHFPNEYVELENVRKCAGIMALTLIDWCGIEE